MALILTGLLSQAIDQQSHVETLHTHTHTRAVGVYHHSGFFLKHCTTVEILANGTIVYQDHPVKALHLILWPTAIGYSMN